MASRRDGASAPVRTLRDTAARTLRTGRRRAVRADDHAPAERETSDATLRQLNATNHDIRALNRQLADKVQDLLGHSDDLANLIESADIATVFLDTQLHIKRFTATAARPFNLSPSDVGRPIGQIATNLPAIDLEADCRAILDGVTALEREATTVDGGEYLLRLFPYRRANDSRITWGVVVTLVDVTRLKEIERDLRAAREQAADDLRRMTCLHKVTARLARPGGVRAIQDDIVAAAVEIAGADMGTLQTCDERGVLAITSQTGFGPAFLDYFGRVDAHSDTACSAAMAARERVVVEDVTKSPYFAGATLPVLLEAGVRALQSTPLFDLSGEFVGMLSTHYRSVRQFGEPELKWLDLLARQAAELITHRQSEEGLSRTNEQLERRIDERVKWLRLLHQVTRAIQEAATWDEAVRAALELTCAAEGWQVGFVYIPDPADADVLVPTVGCLRDERFRPFYEFSEEQRYTKRAQNLPGLVYSDGIVRWVSEAEELAALVPMRRAAVRKAGLVSAVAMPITFGQQVIGVLELFSDQPHTPDQTIVTLMVDISAQIGKIVERERMTAEMADLSWREQQGLLHTLHDTLGQTLTAVNVLSSALGRRLQEADAAASATAGQIVQQARLALNQVRQLSRGMFPVDVESLDIMTALRELASATESIHRLRVQVDGDLSNSALDSRVITHLYRIAQEAVTNAVKHAQADAIRIDVKAGQGFTRLRVTDNGVGIPGSRDTRDGLGLRVMRHRAASIRANLSIRANPAGGTTVACTLRQPPALPRPV